MENRPLWYEMLTTYKEWMGLHTGITIPCMIGAYYEANHSLNLTTPQCLEVILSSILEARIPVKIFRCSDKFPGIKNRGIKKCKAKDNQIIIHFSSVPLF